jgi:hypothetical protein
MGSGAAVAVQATDQEMALAGSQEDLHRILHNLGLAHSRGALHQNPGSVGPAPAGPAEGTDLLASWNMLYKESC